MPDKYAKPIQETLVQISSILRENAIGTSFGESEQLQLFEQLLAEFRPRKCQAAVGAGPIQPPTNELTHVHIMCTSCQWILTKKAPQLHATSPAIRLTKLSRGLGGAIAQNQEVLTHLGCSRCPPLTPMELLDFLSDQMLIAVAIACPSTKS